MLFRLNVPASAFTKPPVVPVRKPLIARVVAPPTTWMSYCVFALVVREPTLRVELEVARMPPVLTVSAASAPEAAKR